MIKKLLEPNASWASGLVIVRIFTGGIIIVFGFEIFDAEGMAGYTQWLTDVNVPAPRIMAYVGKVAELICGTMLTLGLFTRLASIPLMITMIVINFVMLDGNPRNSPFYLLLLFTTFLIMGGGKFSLDGVIRKRMKSRE